MEKADLTIENLQPLVEENLENDGFLTPVVFVCTKEKTGVVDVSEALGDDASKDQMVSWLSEFIHGADAHKVIMVSEAWAYAAPEGMSREELNKTIKEGNYREKFDRTELYQIIAITRDSIDMLTRHFDREEEAINFGEEHRTHEVEMVRFKPIQEALAQIN